MLYPVRFDTCGSKKSTAHFPFIDFPFFTTYGYMFFYGFGIFFLKSIKSILQMFRFIFGVSYKSMEMIF